MTHAVKYHPGIPLLEQYVEGTLEADVALAVSAHIDLCPHCQQLCMDLSAEQGLMLEKTVPVAETVISDMDRMLAEIMAQPQLDGCSKNMPAQGPVQVQLKEKTFTVPRALARLVEQQTKWTQLGSIATTKLPAGDKRHVSLLYIDKDTAIPQHTHKGLEITLVLSGRIVDEQGSYGVGDILINTPDDTHTPRTLPDEDCLCLSVLSAPLQFNKGITRLLNPLQHLFY
ncbi:ChrR family anti-sigma-E factor [Alkalimonas sp. MEB108]|uniref:ChrR family anti-sigma-E factor n=1 Tax=Alkalimonas cellulosilytica TaxID=3058395 RepID=A0ABU7J0Q9_9GAMM|nr:ChrR family anti-sigma-E factor [Alkalimonas sp. MEB108]MEE2000081.1 ChrR family anti-sigma-E factor [Alkalimonas sp. MEB108]